MQGARVPSLVRELDSYVSQQRSQTPRESECSSLSHVHLYDPMDCSPLGCSVHGISQAGILKWVAIHSLLQGSSRPRNQTRVSCIAGGFFTISATREAQVQFSSVQFSCSVMSDSLRPHESKHTRPPCPSPTPGPYSNPCPLSR